MHKVTARDRADHERKNPPEEDPEFQIAPMIDILLVLLVFFMSISTTEALQQNRNILLPVAKDARDASKKNPGQVIVNITWSAITNSGGIEVDEVKYADPSQIVSRLQKAVAANPVARVLVRADKSVRYDYLRTVLKSVGQAGVSNVTFSVVDKEMK